MIRVGQYRQLGVLTYHATSARRGASSTLHYPMPGTSASPCRPALTVLDHHFGVPSSLLRHLGTGSGMEPCPASSSDRVINTEHINQLSCLHAQSFKFLTCVRLGQALYFFWKKVACKNFLVQTLFVARKFKYPVYLGASSMKLFPLAYDYTCTASFLVHVLGHNMHHVDLSVLQAGLPCSCVYPYVPDCSARE